jgi:hypothetical protein
MLTKMRQLLTILFLLAAVGAGAQTIDNTNTVVAPPNPLAFDYPTLAKAISTPMDLGSKCTVKGEGAFSDDTLKAGEVIDSIILIPKPNGHILRRDISQTHGVNLSWFLKPINGTDTTDNYARLQWLLSTACPLTHFIWDKPGVYYSSHSINVQKFVKIEGPDGYEVPANTVTLYFPKATSGLIFNSAASASSYIKGFAVSSSLPEYGRIYEYNPADGRMLYVAPLTTLTAGKTFEFRDAYYPDKVIGTAVISNAGTANINYSIVYTLPTGTFVVGDTVKGTTSGAKAVVRFVSRIFNALAVGTVSGTFAANETLTGTTSGATARFVNIPSPARFGFAKVATISNITGVVDNPGTSVIDSSLINVDTTKFAVTGTIDSLGATGKRQNIFIEQGKYSVGITANRRLTIEDMTVTGFGGDGILVSSSNASDNANLVRMLRVRSNANAANGIRVIGGNSNALSIVDFTLVNDGGFGICDLSFLGIDVKSGHTSATIIGGYTSANYVNRRSNWEGVYSEGGSFVMKPWQDVENYLGGNSGTFGGLHGQANAAPYYRTDGYGGFRYEGDNIQNRMMYTDYSDIRNPKIVFKEPATTPNTIVLEGQGNGGAGRGPAMGFRTPYGTGFQGIDPKNAALDVGQIRATTNTASAYNYAFELRRSIPPTMTITGGSGTGAILQLEIKNGKAIKVNVLAGGKKYPKNGTTISAPNFPNTTFNPLIGDSTIYDVQILGDSLTSNKDNDIYSVAELDGNGTFRPTTTSTGSLGDATHVWSDLYVNNIHTSPSAFIYPDSLVAKTATTGNSSSMLRLYNTGNGAIWRGPTIDIFGPGGTGAYVPFGSMKFVNDASFTRSFILSMYDVSNNADSIIYANYKQVGINTLSPAASAVFHVHSTNLGSLPAPRMTSSQLLGISAPTGGLMVFNREKQEYWFRDSISNNWLTTNKSDTTTIADGMLLIGDAANKRFKRATLTAGTGMRITNGAGSITIAQDPLSKLTATAVTPVTATEMLALHVNGNQAAGRGPLANFYAPRGTGIDSLTVSLGGYWDASSHGAFTVAVGDGASSTLEKMRVTFDGNVLVGTTVNSGYRLDIAGAGRLSGNLTVNGRFKLATPAAGTTSMPSIVWDATDSSFKTATIPFFWQVSGTTLSPINAGYNISTTGQGAFGSIKITDGTQGVGKVLTSDASGNGTWQTATGGGGTNYGYTTTTVTTATFTVPNITGNKTVVLVNFSGTATITLPSAAANADKEVTVKSITANSVNITPVFASDANTIGASSFSAYSFHADAATNTWYLIGRN